MSRADANLILALAGLFVAVVSLVTAIYAIRRDRADLRVTAHDAAAGNRYLIVVNVGLRPVRVERLLLRTWRVTRWRSTIVPIEARVADRLEAGMKEHDLPIVVQPGGEFVLHYWLGTIDRLMNSASYDVLLEDAAGHRFPVRQAPGIQPASGLFPPGG